MVLGNQLRHKDGGEPWLLEDDINKDGGDPREGICTYMYRLGFVAPEGVSVIIINQTYTGLVETSVLREVNISANSI